MQGSVIALSIGIPIYLHVKKIYIPAVFDIAGLYAPLLQSIARIGCFCAGCCSGSPTSVSWAVTYTHQESYAPLFQAIHPSQLYSSLGLFLLFVFMHAVARKITHKPGQLFGIYLMGASLERFINDFWRGEHVPTAHSPEQLLALCLFGVGLVLLWWATVAPTKPYHKP